MDEEALGELKKSAVIKVDEVRTINEFLGKKSFDGNWRIVIIDSADELNINGANAVLKVLEEPPENVYFVLGTASEFPVLPTVRSRAARLEIPPFSEEQITAFLERKYPGCRGAAACAAVSDGCPGRAQRFLQGGKYAELSAAAYACAAAESRDIPAAARALGGVSEKTEFLSVLRRIYRDMLFCRTGQPCALHGEEGAKIRALSARFTPAVLVFALDVLSEAEKQITFNANLSQCVEVALWKIDKEKRKCNKS